MSLVWRTIRGSFSSPTTAVRALPTTRRCGAASRRCLRTVCGFRSWCAGRTWSRPAACAGSFSRLWKSFPRSFESPAPSVLATIPILTGQCESPHEEMFWERRGDRAARVGHWKWVQSQRGTGLFDLSHDVGERNDLSGQRPDMLKHLKARFAAWKESMEQVEPRGPFRDF